MKLRESGENLTIIFQGPVIDSPAEFGDRTTEECLRSARDAYPAAEIILSTWEGAKDLRDICSLQVSSLDPGSILPSGGGRNYFTNINRQIKSTAAGLQVASRRYALKLRTDTWIEGGGLVTLYNQGSLLARPEGLNRRVLINGNATDDPRETGRLFFYPDFYQLGDTNDLRRLWSIPYPPNHYASWSCSAFERWFSLRGCLSNRPEKMAPEQYLASEAAKAVGRQFSFGGGYEFNVPAYRSSEGFLGEVFLPVNHFDTGIRLPARFERVAVITGTIRDFRTDPLFSAADENARQKIVDERAMAVRLSRLKIFCLSNPADFGRWMCKELLFRSVLRKLARRS